MKLDKKKQLAARTLGVGKARIIFDTERLDEIKEIITKQDVRDLLQEGAIRIREIGGRKTKLKGGRRREGKIKKTLNKRKENYIKLTRKLRRHLGDLRTRGKVTQEEYNKIRKQIRSRIFRSKSHMQELVGDRK